MPGDERSRSSCSESPAGFELVTPGWFCIFAAVMIASILGRKDRGTDDDTDGMWLGITASGLPDPSIEEPPLAENRIKAKII